MAEPFPAACVYLTGPTASGKTAVGVELAKLLGGEIVAMDSMTLYRRLDIGTAKPSAEERGGIPHHLLDILEPSEEFSQAEYATAARPVVEDILDRGKVPLFVGGTPLYLKTLLRGMFEGPPPDWELRRELENAAQQMPPGALHALLAQGDPPAATKLHPNDTRRIIRALEVLKLTGARLSSLQQQFDKPRAEAAGRAFVLDWPRAELFARIERRVDVMLEQGLVEETRRVVAASGGLSRTARQALGYREVLEHLAGRLDQAAMVEAIKIHTRQFAKRQGTWFRSLAECRTIAMSEPADPRRVAQKIYSKLCRRAAGPGHIAEQPAGD